MTISANGSLGAGEGQSGAIGLADSGSFYYREINSAQRREIQAAGRRFAELMGGNPCFLLIGRLIGVGDPGTSTELRVQQSCQERFGFPKPEPEDTINVILDSAGGSLDSAFRTTLFLSRYAQNLNIYVPRR